MVFDLPDLAATERFGIALGKRLWPGAVVGLVGPLGAGKTHLSRAVAVGLGIDDPTEVSSPTFGLIHEYAGRVPVYHFDTYRLPSAAAFADLGVHDYFRGDGVCLVEWADRFADVLPAERLTVTLELAGESGRTATLAATGERYERLLEQLRGA